MMEQDVPEASDVALVDAIVREQESSCPPQFPSPSDKSQSPHPETADDMNLSLPTDIHLSDSQDLPDNLADKSATDVKKNANEISRAELEEKKGNENENGDSPIPPEESQPLMPKAGGENVGISKNWLLDPKMGDADEAGTPEEQAEFMKELEAFHKENSLEFKPPKFYGELLNCLKLWRAVIKLGGYEVVTASKLWRQVGESFHPPKTCTTVSGRSAFSMRRLYWSMKNISRMVRFNFLSHLSLQQVLKRRQVATSPQEQAGHVGMLQLVPCRVGMLSTFLDMARSLSQLLRIRA